MRHILKIIFPVIVLAVLLNVSASAQTLKIATVDVGKVFTNYYKFKLAQANITDQQNRIMKDENDMVENLKKGDTEYKSLLASANDQALSADQRDKNKKSADAKLKELQDAKATLDEYDRSAKTRLTEQLQRVHDKLLDEIRAAIASKAKGGGYNMVFDSGAQSIGGAPMLVYNSGQTDLTDDVLKQLNIGAPIDFNTTTPAISPPAMTTNRF
ncbi:MAG TPA: OmpH family outer membrane protein [Candidatus Baltobacteraceae bacterium]|nr:OmpH family outer membrane protein [Candidatus Baltobacteraceae bacterium]